MGKFSHLVTVYDPDTASINWVTISAFCRSCGQRRGVPRLRPRRIDSIDTWIHWWDNPCGHRDTNESVLAEIETQCVHRNCSLDQSDMFYPYCGASCALRSAWDAVSDMRRHSEVLTAPLQTLRRLIVILNTCPFIDESENLRQALMEASRALAKTQQRLASVAGDVIHEATVFIGDLENLIEGSDEETKARYAAWMAFSDFHYNQA